MECDAQGLLVIDVLDLVVSGNPVVTGNVAGVVPVVVGIAAGKIGAIS